MSNIVTGPRVMIAMTPKFAFWQMQEAAANDFADAGYLVDIGNIRIKRDAWVDYAYADKYINFEAPLRHSHKVHYNVVAKGRADISMPSTWWWRICQALVATSILCVVFMGVMVWLN